jgi:hypothetical protein
MRPADAVALTAIRTALGIFLEQLQPMIYHFTTIPELTRPAP